ncbi:MAG: hypothetical protein Q8P12_04480 [bacterium]|nr:hypothetical protein [bacterium]
MDTICPFCSKRIFQVNLRHIYLVKGDTDPEESACVREEVEEARCSSCGRVLPPSLWEKLRLELAAVKCS